MVHEITPLLVGIRRVDQGIMTYQQKYGRRIWLPMWAFLVQSKGNNILIDTGLDDFMTPPEFIEETGMEPMPMAEALATKGLTPDDINIVINTHLHDDHCGNNLLFTKATFYIHAKEIESCRNPHPLDYRYEPDFIEGLTIKPVTDDMEVVPGIKVIYTPGHTPGCMTVQIQTAKGQIVVPGFCCNKENFPVNGPAVCPGVHYNAFEAFDTAQRVKGMEGRILPLHEVAVRDAAC